jgi:hypothetical protein
MFHYLSGGERKKKNNIIKIIVNKYENEEKHCR